MSKIFDIAHEMAKDLFEVGAMDEVTMRTVGIALFARSKGFSARGHPPHSDKKPS
jgi:putative transcriptional regulator